MKNKKPLATISSAHKRFVRKVLEGETFGQAAIDAGYRDRGYGSSLMKEPAIRSLLTTEMEKAGINDTLIAKKLRDGLNAMTPPKKEGGRQYEDQFVRKQFLDVIFKVRGDYAPERSESTEKHIAIIMDGRMVDALRDSKVLEEQDADVLDAEIVREDGRLQESNTESTGPEQVDKPLSE